MKKTVALLGFCLPVKRSMVQRTDAGFGLGHYFWPHPISELQEKVYSDRIQSAIGVLVGSSCAGAAVDLSPRWPAE
jgi:hypothetical protein